MNANPADYRIRPFPDGPATRKSIDSEESSRSNCSFRTQESSPSDCSEWPRQDKFDRLRHDASRLYGSGDYIYSEHVFVPIGKTLVRAANRDYRDACHPLIKGMKDCFGVKKKFCKA